MESSPIVDAPDEIFDATFSEALQGVDETDRSNWIITAEGLRYDPIVAWGWNCPECGATGLMPDDPLAVIGVHGSQHAAGPFDAVTQLLVFAIRASHEESAE